MPFLNYFGLGLLSSAKNNFRYVGEVNMSSRKLDFKTWCNDIGIRECDQTTKCDDCKAAWNFAEAQEKREYELLESEYSELLANFCKVDMERLRLEREAQAKQAMYDEKYSEIHKANVALMDEREELKLQNKKAINAFKALNRYLCNGEHVDLCWVKDEIQLQAESESLIKSKNFLESAKLKRDIDDLKKKLSEAVEVIVFYGNHENWYSHGKDSTIKRMIDLNDSEEFLNYEYGGRRARAFLKGDKDE